MPHQDDYDAIMEARYAEFDRIIEQARKDVIEFANNDAECGWLDLAHRGNSYRFPKRALIWYVFGRMHAITDLLPPYEAFAPMGAKLQLDDPYHTDTLLGAGIALDLGLQFDHPDTEALSLAVREIENEYRNEFKFDFTILANNLEILNDRSSITVQVYDYPEPIDLSQRWQSSHIDCADAPEDEWDKRRAIVIPHAGIEYDLAARNADVIITEVGGPLAHLATVSREKGKLLIRVQGAMERFSWPAKLSINIDDLTIRPE